MASTLTAFRPAGRALQKVASNLPQQLPLIHDGRHKIRHLLSIADLSAPELAELVFSAHKFHDSCYRTRGLPFLSGKTVALMFNKRSTRTRISTETAVAYFGGHPMFLGKDDIQLGVNESLYDSSVVISSMTACIFARVGPHSDVADLAEHSAVPVINALSNDFHPLQTIADCLTIYEAFHKGPIESQPRPKKFWEGGELLSVRGKKIAWIGDSNNVLFDLAIGARKLGMDISVASPAGYGIPPSMRSIIDEATAKQTDAGIMTETTVPEEAIKDADILVTDTWISMGQEEETAKRMKAFEGFQITEELAKRGGAKEGWKFMHCLPRHAQEVDDEVFYGPRSLVFKEAQNRLFAAMGMFPEDLLNHEIECEALANQFSAVLNKFVRPYHARWPPIKPSRSIALQTKKSEEQDHDH